jgi:nitroreductase
MIPADEILDAYHFRHACKVFDPEKKIPEDTFETILETGRLSPSSFGFEPWKFLVVQDPTLREKLLPVTWGAQKMLPTASHYLIILARKRPDLIWSSDYVTHMMRDIHHLPEEMAEARREKYRIFQEEDFRLLESDRALFDWASKQCYITLGNMMTSAAMMGVDSCAVEGFQRDALERIMVEDFGMDAKHFGVAVMAAFGYRIQAPKPKTRQPIEDIVEWR